MALIFRPLGTKRLPAFRTGLVRLQPLYDGGFLEDVTTGRDRGRRLLDGFHRDRAALFGGLRVFEDGIDNMCWISEGCCSRHFNGRCIVYVDRTIRGDILNMLFLYPGTA